MSARERRRMRRDSLRRRFRFFRHGPDFAGLSVPLFPFPAREAMRLARAEVWAFNVGAEVGDGGTFADTDTRETRALVCACFDPENIERGPHILLDVPEAEVLNDYARRATEADALAQLREEVSR